MKKSALIIAILYLFSVEHSYSQCDSWTQKTDFGSTGRVGVFSFVVSGKAYVGSGYDISCSCGKKDNWEYNPATDTWTQKADFAGTARWYSSYFSIGTKGYVGTGTDGTNSLGDFWEYDAGANSWSSVANFGGGILNSGVGLAIGGNGYVGTGYDGTARVNDFWEYAPGTNTWTQKADYGGSPSSAGVAFSIGNMGYIGTGIDDPLNALNEFWEYDPNTDTWTQKANFGGSSRYNANGFSISGYGFIGAGFNGSSRLNDFWEYDTISDVWTQRADFGGTPRRYVLGFAIDGKGYMGMGNEPGYKKDLWEYTPVAPVISSDTVNDVLMCNGDSTGSVIVNATGIETLSYSVDSGATFYTNNGVFSGLPAGIYGIIVKDVNGCLDTGSTFIIADPELLTIDSLTTTDPLCNVDTTGEILISASGGTGGLTYSIDSGSTFTNNNGIFDSLMAGSYDVAIMDSNGCTVGGGAVLLSQPDALAGNMSSTPDSGSGNGTAAVLTTGGSSPYQYSWMPGGQITPTATGLVPGYYTVSITDTNGCMFSDSVEVGVYISANTLVNEPSILVYPNPVHDDLNILFDNIALQDVYIQIFSVLGEEVIEEIQLHQSGTLSIKGLKEGLYFIQIQHSSGLLNKSVVVY